MPRHDPYAALRQRNFRIYAISLIAYGMSTMMLPAAIAWHIFDISDSTLKLGFLGLVRFAPSLFMALLAGAIVDAFDRRLISQLAQGATLICTATLMVLTLSGSVTVLAIYAVVFVMSIAQSFDFPARGALLPSLVTPETFQNAIITSGTIRQLGFISGPALGGLAIGFLGIEWAYGMVTGLVLVSVVVMGFLRPRPIDAPKRAVSLAAITEGVSFVRSRHIILGCMALDMFAVIFGGAQVLLPVYAEDVLGVGPIGFGILAASIDVGALLMSIVLVAAPLARKPGIVLMWAVLAFGTLTMLFGLSQWFLLSIVLYAAIGASDQVSVVMRQTTIQLNTPDELRGRVTSVNWLFVGTSNQLGQMESGFVAAAFGAVFAVVSGGAACLAVLGLVFLLVPEMRRYRTEMVIEEAPAATPSAAGGAG